MTKTRRPTREHKRHSTGDPWLDLLAGIIRQAISDAKRGSPSAAYWLQAVAPSLAHRIGNRSEKQRTNPEVTAQEAAESTKQRKRYKHTTSTAIVEPGPSCGPEITVVIREDRQMSYETTLTQNFNVPTGHDAIVRYERMSKEQRAEYDAQIKARNDADNARIKAEQQAKRDALAAARLADDAQRQQAREAAARDRARRLWAGDDASFDRQWPQMYENLLAQQTTEQLQRAANAQREFMASKF